MTLAAGATAFLIFGLDLPGAKASTSRFVLTDTNQNFNSKEFTSVDGIITKLTISNAVGTGLKDPALNTNLTGFCAYVFNGPGNTRCAAPNSLTGFSMTFDRTVYLSQFDISQFNGLTTGNLTFKSGSQTESINFSSTGIKSFANPFLATAGTAVFVTSSGIPANTLANFRIDEFTVRDVPVPGPLPILGAGVAFAYSRKVRARISRKAS
jgi:hypothetical protein